MFNLGWGEILLIGAAALLIFGPSRLPQLAKSVGEAVRTFRKELKNEEASTPDK
ncbi:MAG: twin-arginine translocase TatA/TatE family subunit [Elusimicrobia bacterium]|nr:twin-arginine translocase TatA/TatE family subunit [Elusimicrobiota bacterium]